MRTIEEFKHDRDQWNRDMANKQRVRLIIGWAVTLVIVAAAAIGGLAYYKFYQAGQANAKPAVTDSQSPAG